jgi:hypothetical protein
VKLNGILECGFLSENADTAQQPQPDDANPNTAESKVKIVHRTLIIAMYSRAACSVSAELMVRVGVRVRVRVAVCAADAFSVWTEFTVPTGKRTPERNAIGHTHGSASSGGVKA